MLNQPQSNKNILVVDDLRTNREYISSFFESKHFTVFTADSAEKSFSILSNEHIDLILLDVEMPQMNGYQACKTIKNDIRWHNIPVIFITSRSDEASTLRGLEVGAQDFVAKPFNEMELYARVKTHLELRAKSEQLIMLNRHLEEIVDQRTAELKQALTELESAYKSIEKSNKQLQSLSLAKTNFLKIISHEMRTPLNGIVGFVDVLQETVQTDELKTYVSYLAKSAARLEKFAADAILISELTVGSYQMYESEFNLQDLISEIEIELEEEIAVKGIRLIFAPIGTTKMFTDRNLMSIALRHIIENSVKYSPEESIITIHSLDDDGIVAQIQIDDDGEGFSKPALDSLFSLFSIGQDHIDNACGLGLALTNMIMHTMNGQITAANRLAGGATVSLFF